MRGEKNEREVWGMKRIITILLALTMVFALSACGGRATNSLAQQTEAPAKLVKLTNEMIQELKEDNSESSLRAMLTFGYRNLYNVTDVKLTKSEKFDDYTYIFYCTMYYDNNYKHEQKDIKVIYQAVEDPDEEKGYDFNLSLR